MHGSGANNPAERNGPAGASNTPGPDPHNHDSGAVRMSAILFDAPRVRDRRPTTTEIVTSYTDDGRGLPILVILSGWSDKRRRYDRKTSFRCEEVPTPLGRGFVLHRNADDVAADGP